MIAVEFATDPLDAVAGPNQPQLVIEVRRLSVEFESCVVLDDIDLSLATGQITALTGANGAGKTTLLRCLAGLIRPTLGDVQWFGQCPQRNLALRRHMGMVAHQSLLYQELTPRENLLFAAQMCDVPDRAERVARLLSESGLQRYADRSTARLSHGLRRRLSVARALVHEPRILLLDEPFSGLDEPGHRWLECLLRELRNQGATVCLTTHEYPPAWRLADRVLRLECGKLQDCTPALQEMQVHDLRKADAA
jgi:heme ABC exporter ATP-binding subunit CcmA